MKLKLIVLILLLALLLTGCYSFASGDALYALPQQSEEYRALQKAVELPLQKDDPFYTVAGIQANAPHFYEKNVSQMELGDSDITLGSFDKK